MKDFDFKEFLEKVKGMSFEDFFPLNRDPYEVPLVLRAIGIYLGAIIVMALLWVMLGGIFILGAIIKFIAIVVVLYSVIGTFHMAFQYMRFN